MIPITEEQRLGIQKKIDAAIKNGLSKDKNIVDAMARSNLYRVRDELLHLLQNYAPPFLDIMFYKKTYSGFDRQSAKPVMPTASIGKTGIINLKLNLNMVPDIRETFGSYYNFDTPPYVNLIQLFNNGVNIGSNTPYGQWHDRWIKASQTPTWRFSEDEQFIQRAIEDIRPFAESLGVRIKYSKAFDDGAGPYLDANEEVNTFGSHYAW